MRLTHLIRLIEAEAGGPGNLGDTCEPDVLSVSAGPVLALYRRRSGCQVMKSVPGRGAGPEGRARLDRDVA
jgi:hypothetical protein